MEKVERLIVWSELKTIVPFSRAAIWQWRKRGDFPKPVRISTCRMAWRESDIKKWLTTRPAA